ncbi:hypothetical protein HK098_004008 [Nowakowskiella sp. JEL0407]|nr:hypothetical protein HK098_004008 [Nowakowskiella sp. JEL0407]
MEDSELQAIRAKRMQQLRASGGGMAGGPKFGGAEGGQEDAEKKSQMEEMRRTMLIQILDNDARERLARITMVKPEKGRAVEDLLIRMAQSGQLGGKVKEPQLIELLEKINETNRSETKIVYNRRRMDDDDDDLEGLFL